MSQYRDMNGDVRVQNSQKIVATKHGIEELIPSKSMIHTKVRRNFIRAQKSLKSCIDNAIASLAYSSTNTQYARRSGSSIGDPIRSISPAVADSESIASALCIHRAKVSPKAGFRE